MGRKTKLTKAVQESICEYLREGNYLSVAGELSGIGTSTVQEWIQRGTGSHERPDVDNRYAAFAEAVAHARSVGEAKLLDVVRNAATGYTEEMEEITSGPDGETSKLRRTRKFSPGSAQWILERAFPDRWGPRQRVEHSGEVTQTRRIVVELPNGMTLDHLNGPETLPAGTESK